ncbi:hypothetical protein ANCDUO_10257 [Ancylostoma duodenale]|uniref:Uncharacterized protein n=1 Tax=Ancylostoma duodenale TaxID=51022 RepID=A0A0C2GE95_9BILA|nr:hypothetical protein ANCDUO_10257 [Ancylostoma duodenale]
MQTKSTPAKKAFLFFSRSSANPKEPLSSIASKQNYKWDGFFHVPRITLSQQLFWSEKDVQPAAKVDGWETEPFVLTERDGKLFGRGSTDDKGPVLCWLHAIEMLQKHKIDIPVNIKGLSHFEFLEDGPLPMLKPLYCDIAHRVASVGTQKSPRFEFIADIYPPVPQ